MQELSLAEMDEAEIAISEALRQSEGGGMEDGRGEVEAAAAKEATSVVLGELKRALTPTLTPDP
jgi:hypothetical protein